MKNNGTGRIKLDGNHIEEVIWREIANTRDS